MKGIEQFLQVDAATLGALKYAGTWNASTNTPTLASGVGVQGQYYVVSVAGSTNLDGETAWQVGDWAVFNGTVWQKVDGGSTGLLSTLTVTGNTYLATTSGNVGVGTTSPAVKLEVFTSNATVAKFTRDLTTDVALTIGADNDGPIVATEGVNNLRLFTNATERMRIDSAGNVGIGTSLPGSRLTVAGNVEIRGGAGTFFGDATNATFPSIKSPALNTIGFFLNSGAETARIDSSGNVGIGTSSPSERLHVSGGGSDGAIRVVGGASGNGYLIARTTGEFDVLNVANAALRFYTNSSVRATIDAAGNLGLGVTPSAWGNGVSMQGSGWSLSTLLGFDQSAMYTNARQTAYGNFNTNWVYRGTASATGYAQASGSHVWLTAPSGTAGNAITWTQSMTLDASGNLLVGTTTAFAKLAVNGSIYAASGNDIQVGNLNNTNAASINSDSNDTSAALVFKTASAGLARTERMRIDTSGNLGLGVTPSAWGNAGYSAINAKGNASFVGLNAGGTNTQTLVGNNWYDAGLGSPTYISSNFATRYTQFGGQHQWFNAPSGTAGNAITFTQAMTLDASGNLGIGTTSPSTRLHVAGASGSNIYGRWSNGTQELYVGISSGNNIVVGSLSNDPVQFWANSSERARIPSAGGMVVGTAALATNATDGFLYVPTCAGTPTGTPTTQTGTAPIVIDTTNNKLYFYSGGQWRDAGP